MTPEEIHARIGLRPADEPLEESIAHAAYWALVDAQEAGATDAEKVALIREWAAAKRELTR